MKNSQNKAVWALLGGSLLFASCDKKDQGRLEGPAPVADFTSTVDASQFPVVVSFKSTSQNSFLYQWNFGDGPGVTSGAEVKHTYQRGGTFKVQLTTAGRGGTSTTSTKDVVVPSACDKPGFAGLTACGGSGTASWTISNQPDAIVRFAADGTTKLSSLPAAGGALPACQLDDEFTFASTFTYSYNAGGQTFANGSCAPALNPNSSFIYKPNAGLGQIILLGKGSFIGLTDSVVNKTYDILEASATQLRLRGTNPNGTFTVVSYMPQVSAVERVRQTLTGGSSRTWKLDNTADKPIIVGPSDAKPGDYYGGGAVGSLPACQADDEFTFTTANVYSYDAMAETFVAGVNGAAGSCQAPRTTSTPFTFGAATGAGIAQFTLTKPSTFIGITDAPDLVYRIISIDNQHMVLRAGSSTASVVFTMKLIVK